MNTYRRFAWWPVRVITGRLIWLRLYTSATPSLWQRWLERERG